MEPKFKLFRILFLGAFALCGVMILLALGVYLFGVLPVETSPEQSAQVEVVGKRIHEFTSGGGRTTRSSTSYSYIVSFKFPDGSVKEFEIAQETKVAGDKKEVSCPAYEALQEGDTGTIRYKEMKNIEKRIKNEMVRYDYRRLITFKRDQKKDPSS